MSPTSDSDSPEPSAAQVPAGTWAPRWGKVALWITLVLASVIAASIGIARWQSADILGGSQLQKTVFSYLQKEPILEGVPGWKRVLYLEDDGSFASQPGIEVEWSTTDSPTLARKRLIAKYRPIYGAPSRAPGERRDFFWRFRVRPSGNATVVPLPNSIDTGASGTPTWPGDISITIPERRTPTRVRLNLTARVK